jgi:serine protein kinase
MSKLDLLAEQYDKSQYAIINEEMSFEDYLEKCYANPKLIRTAYQRIYDMVVSKGSNEVESYRNVLTHYNFFDDCEIPIFGLQETIDRMMKHIKGAAGFYGTEKRILLLHGPVGSSKSTICRLLKRGLEKYSQTPEGAWYTFKWINLPTGADGIYVSDTDPCPMHEEPLRLIPDKMRKVILAELNEIHRSQAAEKDLSTLYSLNVEGELDPRCKFFMKKLLDLYQGDWKQVVSKHIRVYRCLHSEPDSAKG